MSSNPLFLIHRMNLRKIIGAILGVLIIVASIYGAIYIVKSKNTPRPKPAKVVKTVLVDTVNNGVVPIIVPANGNLVARNRVELYSEVQGIFQRGNKLFKPGQAYRSGETIIGIDDAEYYASVHRPKATSTT